MSVHTLSYTVEWAPAGSWTTIAAGDVIDATSANELSGNQSNALAFGDYSQSRCTVKLRLAAISLATWERVPIRVTYTLDGVPAKAFVGVIEHVETDLDV